MLSVRSCLQVSCVLSMIKALRATSFAISKEISFQTIKIVTPKNLRSPRKAQQFFEFWFKVQSSTSALTKPIFLVSLIGLAAKKDTKEIMSEENQNFKDVDELLAQGEFEKALDLLRAFEDQDNSEYQRRFGQTIFELTKHSTARKDKERIKLVQEGFTSISSALEKDDKNFLIHKWYACLLDAKSEIEGVKERIMQLENFEKHIKLAVELNPKDPTCIYILGTFYYSLADFPWYQRKIMSAVFSSPPKATYDKALELCLEAENLQPDFFCMNKLIIGKCYYRLNNPDKAKEYLLQAASIAPDTMDAKVCIEEARKLLPQIK